MNLPVKEWCDDRDNWIKVGMIIHFETCGSPEGWDLYNKWSRRSEKYSGPGDVDARWQSFHSANAANQAVTFGSIAEHEPQVVDITDLSQVSPDVTDVTTQAGMSPDVTDVTKVTGYHSDVAELSPKITDSAPSDRLAHGAQAFVDGFIAEWPADFTTSQLYQEAGVHDGARKAALRKALGRAVEDNRLERSPDKRGLYKVLDRTKEKQTVENVNEKGLDLWLPFNLHEYSKTLPGTITVIGGSTNSGKTTVAMNILVAHVVRKMSQTLPTSVTKKFICSLRSHCEHVPAEFSSIQYLNCEMSGGEIWSRLNTFGPEVRDAVIEQTEFVSRKRDWVNALDPDGLNFIDYLQIYDEFFKIGGTIDDIHERMKNSRTGHVFLLIQKKAGEDNPRGGEFSIERSRLAVNLDTNRETGTFVASVRKLKHPVDYKKKLEGKQLDYDFYEDGTVKVLRPWRFLTKKERAVENKGIAADLSTSDFVEIVEGKEK